MVGSFLAVLPSTVMPVRQAAKSPCPSNLINPEMLPAFVKVGPELHLNLGVPLVVGSLGGQKAGEPS